MLEEIKEKLKGSSSLFITSFASLAVVEQDRLRLKLKEAGASLFVVKNRIAKQIFEQSNLNTLVPLMRGLTAIALGGPDALSVSKALVGFSAKSENLKILGAYVDQKTIDLTCIKRLASIPSKEVLLAQLVYGVKSPIQGLVNTLSATIRNFVTVLDKIREKK